MKNIKSFVSLLLVVIITIVNISVVFADEETRTKIASGSCDDNLEWIFYDDGTLMISGEGDMKIGISPQPPWESYANRIKSVVIEEGVTSIDDSAFSAYDSLITVFIPSSITWIGDYAFYHCSSLSEVTILSKNISFSSYNIFGYTPSFTMKGYSGSDVATYAFEHGHLFELLDTENNTTPAATSLPIASGSCGDDITWILNEERTLILDGTGNMWDEWSANYPQAPWYSYRNNIKNIIINDGITDIGKYAFYKCSNLLNVEIPETVTHIDTHAFYGCNKLISIDIPSNVTNIGMHAFNYCSSLTSLAIPEGVTVIPAYLLSNCTSLIKVYIPSSITDVENGPFYNCEHLANVYYSGSESQWLEITNVEKLLADGRTINYNESFYSPTPIPEYMCAFKDEDGTIFKEDSLAVGEIITLPENPADKIIDGIPYTFDYWEGYTDGMTISEDITFTAVYRKKAFNILYGSEILSVNYGDNYTLNYTPKEFYEFKGYFTQEDGQGEQLTDPDGNSVKPFSYLTDIVAFPHETLTISDTVVVKGDNTGVLGEGIITENIIFASSAEAGSLSVKVQYPTKLTLVDVIPVDFKYATLNGTSTDNGITTATIICQYADSGVLATNEISTPFKMTFTISTNAEPATEKIIPSEVILYNNIGSYNLTDYIAQDFEILPKTADSISIIGSDNIYSDYVYTAVISPEYTTNKTVEWSVSDETIATVSQDGVLTPLKNGVITLTATTTDGSQLSATKTVQVYTYAKINSLSSDMGIWDKEFSPNIYEYVIYLDEQTESIDLTASFTDGVLKYNNAVLMINNVASTIPLSGTETTITLNRYGVEDVTNSTYTIKVIIKEKTPLHPIGNYSDKIVVDEIVLDETIRFTITTLDSTSIDLSDVKLYLAEYDSSRLTSVHSIDALLNSGNKISFVSELPQSNEYKYMLLDARQAPLIDAVTAFNN